ncbi:MAG: hypothetical protein HY907_05255 [Deltaproteobacteria bacterium]|nr:hypothetical protein [Deltaproteobacteria bacterium]
MCALTPVHGAADEGDGTALLTVNSEDQGLRIWVLEGPRAWPRSPASPATPSFLCVTPCEVEVPSGEWRMRAGESHEFRASVGLVPQHWVVSDDRVWMKALAVFFDILGGGMLGGGPVLIGLGAAFDAEPLLTAGAAIVAVGGALLLSSIPLWVLWPGSAERVDPDGGIAVDGIAPWLALASISGQPAPAAGLVLHAHWAGW